MIYKLIKFLLNNNITNCYSETEQETGKTWLDDKKVYRKSFSGSYASGTTILTNVDNIISLTGDMLISGSKRAVPFFKFSNSLSYEGTVMIKSNGDVIILAVDGNNNVTAQTDIIIEYTKLL